MRLSTVILGAWIMVACGGGGGDGEHHLAPSYSVGGSIDGLGSANGLSLVNGTEMLIISPNSTTFTLALKVAQGATYNVTIGTQPTGAQCKVADGSGAIANADVSAVSVNCVHQATVSTLAGDDGRDPSTGIFFPALFTVDGPGNIYVAGDHPVLAKISPDGTIATLAGNGAPGFVDGRGAAARFAGLSALTVDSAGNVYVADLGNNAVRKVTPDGVVTTLAGNGTSGFADGRGTAASFGYLAGLAVDNAGNVYVADAPNHAIRKITPAGVVTTVAGNGAPGFTDGVGAAASFKIPLAVAVDKAGNVYIADSLNYAIRKLSPAGEVTTLVGNGTAGFTDGAGSSARFNYPTGIALDGAGTAYVTDHDNLAIRKITAAGVVSTIKIVDSAEDFDNGIAADSDGNVYVVDGGNNAIRKTSPSGVVTLIAGSHHRRGAMVDGIGLEARFGNPAGLAVDNTGNAYVADSGVFYSDLLHFAYGIRKVSPTGLVATFVESVTPIVADRSVFLMNYHATRGVAVDGAGNVYVSDASISAIQKISPLGVITTLAGGPTPGSADGIGDAARFMGIRGIAVDRAGNVYVADCGDYLADILLRYSAIRKISPDGVVTTLAGGTAGFADGAGAAARFYELNGIAVDSAGNIYAADAGYIYHSFVFGAHAIRKITPNGVVTTLAGNETAGNSDGNGAAARFDAPRGVALDNAGNVYVADSNNNAIRKVSPSGIVTTLAGNGSPGYVNGTGDMVRFFHPESIAADDAGNLYVADKLYGTIRKIVP